jgi:orotate phosphoribosyltransferase
MSQYLDREHADRDELRDLIGQLAVVRGRVVLSGGQEADWYVDLRRITLHQDAAPMVGRVLLRLTEDWVYAAAGGLTLGADPVAAAMLHQASTHAVRRLDAFVVRKEGKAHGLQRRIEGPEVAGRQVLVVEDTSTTGGSALAAVAAVRQAGAGVAGVAAVVDRGGSAAVRAAGLQFRAAYTLADLGLA